MDSLEAFMETSYHWTKWTILLLHIWRCTLQIRLIGFRWWCFGYWLHLIWRHSSSIGWYFSLGCVVVGNSRPTPQLITVIHSDSNKPMAAYMLRDNPLWCSFHSQCQRIYPTLLSWWLYNWFSIYFKGLTCFCGSWSCTLWYLSLWNILYVAHFSEWHHGLYAPPVWSWYLMGALSLTTSISSTDCSLVCSFSEPVYCNGRFF